MASVDELWLVDFGEPYGGEPAHHRPALVVGPPETFGVAFPFVIVCPLTTTVRGLSLHIEVEASAATGLDDVSYVQCELLRSVYRGRLVHRLGDIDTVTSNDVTDVLRILLGH
jgi:mRNA interferase MazF